MKIYSTDRGVPKNVILILRKNLGCKKVRDQSEAGRYNQKLEATSMKGFVTSATFIIV